MGVKIVTDSTSDISADLARSLGIEVVPGYVRFGQDTYRDGLDISRPAFYQELADSPFDPVTSEATPKDFAETYSRCAHEAEGIVSIHISSRISRMFDSARKGKRRARTKCAVEVIDSHFASISLGLIVVRAAKLANAGESIEGVVGKTKEAIGQIRTLGFFDTMRYVARGGRTSKHVMELSSMLRVKPLLAFKDGEVVVEGLVRTHSKGIERLAKFVGNTPGVQDLGIAYSTDNDSAIALSQRLGSVFPVERMQIARMGAALGSHCGPGAIFVALLRDR